MENSHHRSESKESAKNPLFGITLMRHEATNYTEKGDDLTDEGKKRACETGRELAATGRFSGKKIYLQHSPSPRAAATLRIMAECAGIAVGKVSPNERLRKSDFKDRDAFMELVKRLDSDQEAIAKEHHTNPDFQSNPDFIEPNDEKRKRLYSALNDMIGQAFKPRWSLRSPHMVAVSHFELITLLLADVFGIEALGRYNSPSFGEHTTLEFYITNDSNLLCVSVSYNGHTKDVVFNRSTQSIQPL